jgi:hypothetical protein
LRSPQKRDVRLADHAAVHDPDALGDAVFGFHGRDDLLDGRNIGAVARKRLEGQRQTLRRADQPDADLFVAAALIPRVAALGLRIARGFALEVGARHIVEQKLEAHAEPLPVTRHQVRAQRVLVGAELVEGAVEPRVVDQARVHAEQIVERRGVIPVLGHAQFRALRAEPRDGEQRRHVRPRDRLAPGGQERRQQLVELEPVPEREAEVALAEISRALDAQPADIGAFPLRGRRWRERSRRSKRRSRLQPGQLRGPRGGRARGRFAAEQRGQIVPAAPQSSDLRCVQLAQRSDDPLTRPPRRAHRLTQMPIAVTDAARLFVFSPQEHAGIIAESAAPNKGVFGTTLSASARLPGWHSFAADASPLKLFSPTFPTDELGIIRRHPPQPRDVSRLLHPHLVA